MTLEEKKAYRVKQDKNTIPELAGKGDRHSLTKRKLIFIICLRALKPHSFFSLLSKSRTFWKLCKAACGSSSFSALEL